MVEAHGTTSTASHLGGSPSNPEQAQSVGCGMVILSAVVRYGAHCARPPGAPNAGDGNLPIGVASR